MRITNTQLDLYPKYMEWFAQTSAVITAFLIPISTTLCDITYVLSIISILLAGDLKNRYKNVIKNPVAISFIVLFLIYLFGMTYSIASYSDAMKDILKHKWMFLTPIFFGIFNDDKWQNRAVNAFLLAMAVTLVLSYFKSLGWINFSNSKFIDSVFHDHIVQNSFMAFAAILFAYRFTYSTKFRYFYLILFLLATFSIFILCGGRTGYFVFAVLLIYLGLLRYKWRGVFFGSIALLLLFSSCYLYSVSFKTRISTAIHEGHQFQEGNKSTSIGLRMTMLKQSWEFLKEKPLLGYGTGSIGATYNSSPNNHIAKNGFTDLEYFNILIKFGIVGLLSFLIIIYVQWNQCKYLDDDFKFVGRSLIIAFLVSSVANAFFTASIPGHLYSILTAALFSSLPRSRLTSRTSAQ